MSDRESLSQRHLSRELGIALGLANAYIRRCVRKGLVKVRRVPRNRYAYYLTRKGFAEKSRLTVEYLARSFAFYREARTQVEDCFDACIQRGYRRVALCGSGELAEIAILVASQHEIELVGVVEDGRPNGDYFGHRYLTVEDVGAADAVVLTDLRRPQAAFELLSARARDERILAPPMLQIVRGAIVLEDQS